MADLISDPQVPDSIREKVVRDLAHYIPNEGEKSALSAAGEYARKNRINLDIEQVQRMARATGDSDLVVGLLARERKATPQQIVETLVLLGPPYSGLGEGAGHEFDLPAGSSYKTLFERLETEGKVELVKRGLRGGRAVRRLAE